MNIYEALARDHRYFDQQLGALLDASQRGGPRWRTVLDELQRGLFAHSHAESCVLYGALRALGAGPDVLAVGHVEQASAEAELRSLGFARRTMAATERVARDLRRHMVDEETVAFQAARALFSDAEAEQLGRAFLHVRNVMVADGDALAIHGLDLGVALLPARVSAQVRGHRLHA